MATVTATDMAVVMKDQTNMTDKTKRLFMEGTKEMNQCLKIAAEVFKTNIVVSATDNAQDFLSDKVHGIKSKCLFMMLADSSQLDPYLKQMRHALKEDRIAMEKEMKIIAKSNVKEAKTLPKKQTKNPIKIESGLVPGIDHKAIYMTHLVASRFLSIDESQLDCYIDAVLDGKIEAPVGRYEDSSSDKKKKVD